MKLKDRERENLTCGLCKHYPVKSEITSYRTYIRHFTGNRNESSKRSYSRDCSSMKTNNTLG